MMQASKLTVVGRSIAALALIFLLPGMASAACKWSPAEQQKNFAAAMKALDAGQMDRAEELLVELHGCLKTNFAVDESLGMIYAEKSRYAEALTLFQAGVLLEPRSDAAHLNYGAALYQLHDLEKARAELQRAVTLNPHNAQALESLGKVAADLGQSALAAKSFCAASHLEPGNPDWLYACAAKSIDAADWDAARAALKGYDKAGNPAQLELLMAEVSEHDKDFPAALAHLGNAAKLDPSEANLLALGNELLRHWTFDPAAKQFAAALVRYPQSRQLKLGLGAAYFGGAKYAQAIPVFLELLAAEPENRYYAELVGMACTVETGVADARCLPLLEYARQHPEHDKVRLSAAVYLMSGTPAQSQLDEARAMLAGIVTRNAKNAEAQYQLGKLEQDEGNWAASIAPLEKAVAAKPDYALAHYHLALALSHTGHKQQAAAEIALQKSAAQQESEKARQMYDSITVFLLDTRKK